MSPEFYKILHLTGFAALFLSLGGMATGAFWRQANPAPVGEDAPTPQDPPARKLWAALHGVGLLLLLVAGFGSLAKLYGGAPPPWAWGKLVIWLALGASPVLFKRKPSLAAPASALCLALALGAILLAIFKPGG